MAKALTYDEFDEYAIEHYNKGGDVYAECWTEADFDEHVKEFGPITKSVALKMFKRQRDLAKEECWGW